MDTNGLNQNSAGTAPIKARGGFASFVAGVRNKVLGVKATDIDGQDLDSTDSARPGFILESDRYSKASWERQGSGWM